MKQTMIIGAPSSSGIRPYEDGRMRRLDLALRALRNDGLIERLSALNDGNIEPPPIHLDADVLDLEVLAAVDSPVPGGLGSEELERLLVPLVRHPQALGLGLTMYDPALDPDRRGARALAALLESVLKA